MHGRFSLAGRGPARAVTVGTYTSPRRGMDLRDGRRGPGAHAVEYSLGGGTERPFARLTVAASMTPCAAGSQPPIGGTISCQRPTGEAPVARNDSGRRLRQRQRAYPKTGICGMLGFDRS